MKVLNQKDWKDFKANEGESRDFKFLRLIPAAEMWADAMEKLLDRGTSIDRLTADTCFAEVDNHFGNFSGLQFSVIREILSKHWVHRCVVRELYNLSDDSGEASEEKSATVENKPTVTRSSYVTLWYFIGMANDQVIHTEHDVLASGDDGRNQAELHARKWFDGVVIEGNIVEFDRVVALSEHHETALDIRKPKK